MTENQLSNPTERLVVKLYMGTAPQDCHVTFMRVQSGGWTCWWTDMHEIRTVAVNQLMQCPFKTGPLGMWVELEIILGECRALWGKCAVHAQTNIPYFL